MVKCLRTWYDPDKALHLLCDNGKITDDNPLYTERIITVITDFLFRNCLIK